MMGDELFHLFGHINPDSVLLRWLRARKWEVLPAVEFMMNTLTWRHEWGVQRLMAKGENDLILDECASSKIYYMGKDRTGRPITYVHAKEHVKGQFPLEATGKLIVLLMELGIYLVESPVEEGTVVLDMSNVAYKNLDYSYIKFMINTMQNYYPECLGLALVVNAPWQFNTVWNMIRPWLDPVVQSKIYFVKTSKDLAEYIDPDVLPQRLEGSQIDFKFIPATKEDETRLTIIRNDKEGMKKAQMEHREAAEHYLDITLKWASTQTRNEDDEILRTKATKRLSDTYKQLTPYISTRTYYHRIGVIQDPIFDVVYDRICSKSSK